MTDKAHMRCSPYSCTVKEKCWHWWAPIDYPVFKGAYPTCRKYVEITDTQRDAAIDRIGRTGR